MLGGKFLISRIWHVYAVLVTVLYEFSEKMQEQLKQGFNEINNEVKLDLNDVF